MEYSCAEHEQDFRDSKGYQSEEDFASWYARTTPADPFSQQPSGGRFLLPAPVAFPRTAQENFSNVARGSAARLLKEREECAWNLQLPR